MKKYIWKLVIIVVLILSVLAVYTFRPLANGTIVIGALFSTQGVLANSEAPVLKAIKLAVDEINQSGGVKGKTIKIVSANPDAKLGNYGYLADQLIVDHKANIIIGCWTSACRKDVKNIVEKHNALLIYPNQYEGVEESKNIIYLGATPNQQSIPAIHWMMKNHGKKVYLVGSDYIYPHVANQVARSLVNSMGGEVVGESYISLGGKGVEKVVGDITEKKPDFVINNINGNTNIQFFNQLYSDENQFSGPTISFSLADAEINNIQPDHYKYLYTAWTYYRSLPYQMNRKFLKQYKNKYGSTKEINDPAATAYSAVFLLENAIKQAGDITPSIVREYMLRTSVKAPMGVLYVDGFTGHAWRQAIIAKIADNGEANIVWRTYNPIEPLIYPRFKTKLEWELYEYNLYVKWNKSWENRE